MALRHTYGIARTQKIIGCVARFSPEKGLSFLIDAFVHLSCQECVLLLVGDGQERDDLQNKIPPAYVNQIIFTGPVSDVYPFYQLMDVFVLPSLEEAFGLVLLEAMQSGLPVISTDASGPREVLRNQPVTLVPRGDSAALSQAMQKILKNLPDKPLVYDLQRFQAEHQIAKIQRCYAHLLASGRQVCVSHG